MSSNSSEMNIKHAASAAAAASAVTAIVPATSFAAAALAKDSQEKMVGDTTNLRVLEGHSYLQPFIFGQGHLFINLLQRGEFKSIKPIAFSAAGFAAAGAGAGAGASAQAGVDGGVHRATMGTVPS